MDKASFVGVTSELAQTFDYILMEFYSHWCPACKAFQPAYKEIATHIKTIMDEEDVAWNGIGVRLKLSLSSVPSPLTRASLSFPGIGAKRESSRSRGSCTR
jgi:thiol-disulfide isomerase/thioredoxin